VTLLRVCKCGRLIDATKRRCPACDRADSTRRRHKPSGQIYQSAKWRGKNGTRQRVLKMRRAHMPTLWPAGDARPSRDPRGRPPSSGPRPVRPEQLHLGMRQLFWSSRRRTRARHPGGTPTVEKPIQPAIPRPLAARESSQHATVVAFRGDNQWVRPDGTKSCSKCERVLPVDAFRANPKLRSGFDSWCRECQAVANRRWRTRRREAKTADARRLTGVLVVARFGRSADAADNETASR
jgi:hypothetical protein